MRRIILIILVVTIALMIVVVAYSYLMRSMSVLYRFNAKGNPVKEPAFAIFNPFRDRAPEDRAESFLNLLKEGKCEEATAALSFTPEYRQELCGREEHSRLLAWKLTNRTDDSGASRMYYQAQRIGYDGYQGQLWVTVERRDRDWQVTRYECFY